MANLEVKVLFAMNDVLKRLAVMRRGWTSLISDIRYNEMSKQAMNCLLVYILAAYAENAGEKIDWTKFPKIVIYRSFKKVYVNFDTPEKILSEIRNIGGINKGEFDKVTKRFIEEKTSKEFCEEISKDIGNSFEMKLYRAATQIAKFFEILEQRGQINETDFDKKNKEISKYLEEFKDISGFDEVCNASGTVFKILNKISNLRNQKRWAVQIDSVYSSVLGHLFETGVFAYFMSKEQNPDDEELAAKMFFMGIFHDVAESWTMDLPSPIKDKIEGFRKATEEYELKVLDEEVYVKVPKFLADKLRAVMFEDEINWQYKKLLKGADYLSASAEIWRACMAGSRDAYFLGAILRNKDMIDDGRILMPPCCKALYNFYLDEVKNIHYNLQYTAYMMKNGYMAEEKFNHFHNEVWPAYLYYVKSIA